MSVSGEKLGVAGSSTMWFHRSIGRMETEKLLMENKDDGSFLIRESDTVKGAYVLSTIYQHRIHHYRIIPNEDGKLSIQAQPGAARKLFSTLDELVDYYAHPNRGLVCALTRPIASDKDEDIPDEQEESDDEPDEEHREENIISKFLLAHLSTLPTSTVDEAFIERLKSYLSGDITADVQSMSGSAPQLTHLKQLFSADCQTLHRHLDQLMIQVDLLQSLFERAGGAKEVGRSSSFSKRRSRVGGTDFDSLSVKLKDCSESVHNLEKTAFQMLRELSASMTGRMHMPGSLTQVGSSPHLSALTNSSEQDHEEVIFEVKTDSAISGRKTHVITVNLKEGKLSFKKQGESHSNLYSHQQVLQMIKSRSKEARLGILMEGQSRKDYNFASMQAREHFCQLIQLIRNRMKSPHDLDSVSIFVGTWNMGDQSPPQDISSWFRSVGLGKTLPQALDKPHDIYAVGTQECSISEKEWLSKIRSTLKCCYDIDYEKVASQTLWGIRLIILAKPEHVNKISHIQSSQVRTGIGNALGNKGAVGISFFYGSASLCFINAHLTSGIEKCHRRNQNYFDILKGMGALKQRRLNQFYLTNQFHHLFFFGDLNYRVDLGATEIVEFAKKAEHSAIYVEDQLRKDKEKKKIFVGFDEAPILFPPTYRFARGRRTLDDYVWVKQKRSGIRINVPSYCDRVLWSSYPGTVLTNSSYGACNDIMTSDHSPLFASFEVNGVKQYVSEAGRGVGGGINNTFIIVDSLKAKIQTSSKTYFYMEMYSLCFEGAHRSGPNNEWIDTQAGYVWPVWCGRDYVAKLKPIVTELEYLEQQHLLIQLKSLESDEPYAECCLSLRGLFSPKPVNVGKTLIHQGLEVGELDAYIHVTLDQYRKPEDELYSAMNFIVDQSDLDGGRTRGRLGTGHNSEVTNIAERPMLPTPTSAGPRQLHSMSRKSSNSTVSSSSAPPPPIPKRRDTGTRPPAPAPYGKQENRPPAVPVRRSESMAMPSRNNGAVLSGPPHLSTSLTNDPIPPPTRPRGPGSNPPVPTKRKIAPREPEGPQVPPRHHGRDLELPPPLPPKSPEPLSLPHQAEKRPSSVEDLLAVHGLSQYTQRLIENGYDDIHFIADITDWELQEIGVTQYSERQRLLKIFSGYRL